jgi:hypothetical protein
MRNIVIDRITEYLVLYTDLQLELDISPEELQNLSNEELLDLYEEILFNVEFGVDDYEDS